MTDTNPTVVRARALSYSYRDDAVALQDLSFAVQQAEVVAVIGANGAGKSTLIKCLAGLLRRSGDPAISIAGTIGLLPQENWLDPYSTARASLALQAKLSAAKVDWRDRHAQTWLERLGLDSLMDQRVMTMSGGEQRRVALGCALVNRPALLLMDEPTNGLDIQAQAELWSHLSSSAESTPLTILFISHDMFEVETRATRVLALRDGQLLEDSAPADLVAKVGACTVTVETQTAAQGWGESIEALSRAVDGATSQAIHPHEYRLFLPREPSDREVSALLEISRKENLTFTMRPANLEDYFFRFLSTAD